MLFGAAKAEIIHLFFPLLCIPLIGILSQVSVDHCISWLFGRD